MTKTCSASNQWLNALLSCDYLSVCLNIFLNDLYLNPLEVAGCL